MKKLLFIIITIVLAATACGRVPQVDDKSSAYVFTDSLGREVKVDSYEKTVVASGSLAEIWQLSGGTLFGVTSDAFNGHDLGLPEDINVYGDVKHPSAESIIADGVDFVILSETVSGHIELEETFESAGVPAWIFIAAGITAALMLSRDLDVLALGDSTAGSLGMNTSLMRFVFLAVAALLAGTAVSFSGLIGFVGLIIPHIARKITGTSENPYVIPVCALLGGAFLCGCDTIARTLFSPFELPAGIVVSYIGVPFFLWLLIRKKGEKHSA